MPNLDLRHRDFRGADMAFAFLAGVDFRNARMEGASFFVARMEGANLAEARMEGANFFAARMEGANLAEARMEGANFFAARIEGASFHSADLKSAILADAFAHASVRMADLRSVSVTQEILNNLFGDIATKIPDGLDRPDHWDTETIDWYNDDPKFEAWLQSRKAGANPRE